MANFADSGDLYTVLGGFLRAQTGSEITRTIGKTGMCIQFKYHEPEALITLIPTGEDMEVLEGETARQTDVQFEMKADIAHRFWLGKINLPVALARQQIIARGPVQKALKLLPIIQPLYARYEAYLREIGRENLVNV
ncbi:MAG TPA: hypothetical protein VMW83_09080 [Spirochaetia bacterium]|nr:hypothetical protein [Spirochaetia bacterium]